MKTCKLVLMCYPLRSGKYLKNNENVIIIKTLDITLKKEFISFTASTYKYYPSII